MEASLDGPSVDAVSLYNLDDLLEVFNALTAGHKVVCRVTNDDRVIFAALLVDLVDDVGEKLAATLVSPPYSSVRWLEYLEMKRITM